MKVSKFIVFLTVFFVLVSGISYGAENDEYGDILKEIGIIKGTDAGLEADKTFTRAEAAVVMVRLLGKEDDILSEDYTEKFADVPESHWSFEYVMFCYENGITKGTGEKTFYPDSQIDAVQFVTLLVRLMGYKDAQLNTAPDLGVEIQLFNSQTAEELKNSNNFKRGDMFYVLYRSLKTTMKDGTLFARYLAEQGIITDDEADEFDAYSDFENIDELIEELLGGEY